MAQANDRILKMAPRPLLICSKLTLDDGSGLWVSRLYRGYSKLRTHTALGPYGRSVLKCIRPS